jgi:hypothetical protein
MLENRVDTRITQDAHNFVQGEAPRRPPFWWPFAFPQMEGTMLAMTLELIVRMQRVRSFLAGAPKLTEGFNAMQGSFDAALAVLVSLSTMQAALSQAESAEPRQLKELRERLRADHMPPIAEIARQHYLPCHPMPSASDRTENLIESAHAVSLTAERFAAAYVALCLPAGFVPPQMNLLGSWRNAPSGMRHL